MPYDPTRRYVTGYLIDEPDGDRPYFCHRVPKEYVRARGARVFGFAVRLPPSHWFLHEPTIATIVDGSLDADAIELPTQIIADIITERRNQDAKFPVSYPDGTGTDEARRAAELLKSICTDDYEAGRCTFASVLAEEAAEALAEDDRVKLRAELVQVAAVCVKWIQTIDSE